MPDLEGKVAIVTGAGRYNGIGRYIALALARDGADVVITGSGRSPDTFPDEEKEMGWRDIDSVADEIRELGRRALPLVTDMLSAGDAKRLTDETKRELGRVDILVNCAAKAGGQGPVPSLSEITDELFFADMNVKVMGYLRCAREVAPLMREQGWGRIINISGLAARQAGSTIGSMRNVAVSALTKNLAEELGPHGINVTVVHPGLTRTERTAEVVAARAASAGLSEAEVEAQMAAGNLVRRMIDASDIANIVVFLASPKSVAINGDAIAAGGGVGRAIHY